MILTPILQPTAALSIPYLSTCKILYQQQPAALIEKTIMSGEGTLSDTGALVVHTGVFTGRSPKDKFIVSDEITRDSVHWNSFNQPIDESYFFTIRDKIHTYLGTRQEVWVRDCYAGADDNHRLNVRVISEKPWTDLFVHNMFIRLKTADLMGFAPDWTVISVPGLQLESKDCGTRQGNAAVISFTHKTIFIAGTAYTGEIKKGIFSVLNFLLPRKGVLSIHCSANQGYAGDVALFFGLSGTGKTTLSSDNNRRLIGDDEHGWSADGIFNFEGGCYAKTINLDQNREPAIFNAIRYGALLENVHFVKNSHEVDYTDNTTTENTRVSYPLRFIANALEPSIGKHPTNIFFLTCDAHGVLPPISKLTPAQAMYHFISGYTAKIAGTETGITEPKSTFSACFGAPFIPLHPARYAALLGDKMRSHPVNVWLINTGWTGGGYGVGHRIEINYTRAMIQAALQGKLDAYPLHLSTVFGLQIPFLCPGIPDNLLNPRNTWQDTAAYDKASRQLAAAFKENFKRHENQVSPEVRAAGPQVID